MFQPHGQTVKVEPIQTKSVSRGAVAPNPSSSIKTPSRRYSQVGLLASDIELCQLRAARSRKRSLVSERTPEAVPYYQTVPRLRISMAFVPDAPVGRTKITEPES